MSQQVAAATVPSETKNMTATLLQSQVYAEAMLLSVNEAAKRLSVSPRTLWTLTNTGEIPSVRIGKSVRYEPSDLRDYIARNKS
jgi:excisionase family DNA binding protein